MVLFCALAAACMLLSTPSVVCCSSNMCFCSITLSGQGVRVSRPRVQGTGKGHKCGFPQPAWATARRPQRRTHAGRQIQAATAPLPPTSFLTTFPPTRPRPLRAC